MLILHHDFFVTNKPPASKVIVRVHLMILTLRTQVSSRKGVCRILFLKDFGIGTRKPNPYGEMFWIARVKCFHFKSPNAWMILANMQLMLHPKQINITTWIGQKDAKRHCWCFCWLKNKAIWLFLQYLYLWTSFFSTGHWFLCVLCCKSQAVKTSQIIYSVILNNDKINWPTRLRFFHNKPTRQLGSPGPRCKTTGQTLLFHGQAWGVVRRHFVEETEASLKSERPPLATWEHPWAFFFFAQQMIAIKNDRLYCYKLRKIENSNKNNIYIWKRKPFISRRQFLGYRSSNFEDNLYPVWKTLPPLKKTYISTVCYVSRDLKKIDPNMDDWHTPWKIVAQKNMLPNSNLCFSSPPRKVEPKSFGSTPNEEFRILVEIHSGKLTWLAGISPYSIGNTSSFMVHFFSVAMFSLPEFSVVWTTLTPKAWM